jgi:hypothetical protein
MATVGSRVASGALGVIAVALCGVPLLAFIPPAASSRPTFRVDPPVTPVTVAPSSEGAEREACQSGSRLVQGEPICRGERPRMADASG